MTVGLSHLASHPLTPTGRTLIGGFDYNGQSFAFINCLKLGTNISGPAAFQGTLDVNGYPTVSPTGSAISMTFVIPLTSVDDTYRIVGTGTLGPTQVSLPSGTFTVQADVGTKVTSNSGTNLTFAGTAIDITVKLNSLPDTGNGNTLTLSFLAGSATTFVSPSLSFHRNAHHSLFTAGEIFNPDFINIIRNINPKTIRPMDWLAINTTVWARHDYRAPTAALSYRTSRWHSPSWAGTIGNTGSAYSCSAPSNWTGLVDGATVQGVFTNASPSTLTVSGSANSPTHPGWVRLTVSDTTALANGQNIAFTAGSTFDNGGIWVLANVVSGTPGTVDLAGSVYTKNETGSISVQTLNVGSTGAKLISGSSGNASVQAATSATVVYDAVRDSWFYTPRGLGSSDPVGSVPVEILVALCNKTRKNLWYNFHLQYTDASVLSCATYVRDNLAAGLTCYYELSNETWNPGFTQADHVRVSGGRLGFTASKYYSYMALRCRMIFGIVKSVYASSTAAKCVLAFQGFNTDTAGLKTYMLEGAELVTGNSTYNSYTGSTAYNASPNRPIDYIDAISYATYYAGGVLNNGVYTAAGTYTGLTGASDDYASGDPTRMASALSWVDTDLRSGTSTISGGANTVQTIKVLHDTIYPRWETVAQSYDAARVGAGLSLLTIDCYEGGFEGIAPTTTDCTTISISTSYGNTVNGSGTITARGTIQNLLDAYKASAAFKQATYDQYDQFMTTALVGGEAVNHSSTPAWFALQGISTNVNGRWSMMDGSTYSNKYGSYNGAANYNG